MSRMLEFNLIKKDHVWYDPEHPTTPIIDSTFLNSFYHIPKNATAITLAFYTSPGTDRHRTDFYRAFPDGDPAVPFIIVYDPGNVQYLSVRPLDSAIIKTIQNGKNPCHRALHLQIEYDPPLRSGPTTIR